MARSPSREPDADAPRTLAAKPTTSWQERDRPVSDLAALGPEAIEKLNLVDVSTVHQLADSDPAALSARMGVTADLARDWRATAELADVKDVPAAAAHLLARSGIHTIAALAAAEAEVLRAKLDPAASKAEKEIVTLKNVKRWIRAAQGHPRAMAALPVDATPAAPRERIVVIPTRGYWIALGLSILLLAVAAGLYTEYLPEWSIYIYWATAAVAFLVIAWSIVGLFRRGRVLHRAVVGTRRVAGGVAEGMRARSEAHEGAIGRFVGRWRDRFARLFGWIWKLVVIIFGIPWRILVWIRYSGEKLVWRIILLGYDVVYYLLYAAWQTALFLGRVARRVAWVALKIGWYVVRIPLFIPPLRGLWRNRLRPPILASWKNFRKGLAIASAKRIERGRRLAVTRGENPDHWEADHRIRRGFPMSHPEKARVWIRKRIAHISAVQKARKEGSHVPRWKRRKMEREAAQKAESQAEVRPPEPPTEPSPQAVDTGAEPAKPKRGLKVLGAKRKPPAADAAPSEA